MPRVAAAAVSVFALTIVSCAVVMFIAYLVMYGAIPRGFEEFSRTVARVFDPGALAGLIVKCLAFGAVVAVIPIAAGLDATRDASPPPVAVMGGMVRLFFALALIELVVAGGKVRLRWSRDRFTPIPKNLQFRVGLLLGLTHHGGRAAS